MSVNSSVEPPEEARWALALEGIRRLEIKIDTLSSAQQGQQDQLTDLRQAYVRMAPLFTVTLLEQDLRRLITALEGRMGNLEGGALAAVLSRLNEDAAQRQSRQAHTDRVDRWRIVGQIVVAAALLILAAAVLWIGSG